MSTSTPREDDKTTNRRATEDSSSVKSDRRARRMRLLILAPPLAFVLLLFVYPALELLWRSFTDPESGFGNYARIATDPVVGTVIVRTVIMAAIVTVTSVVIAYPYAHLMSIATDRWRMVLTAVVLIPLWTSLMARTFAWIVLLQNDGPVSGLFELFGFGPVTLLGTTPGVVIAMAQVMLPFVVMPMYTNMKAIDLRLLDASRSLGAKPFTVFRKIYLPLSFPGIASGATLVLVLSLGFYVTPALIGTPQNSMFGQYIAVQINELVAFGYAGALAVALVAVTLILLGGVRIATKTKMSDNQSSISGR